MFRSKALALQLTALAFFLGSLATAEDAGPKPTPDTVKKWVARLGSEEYRAREQATRQLMQMEEALPALEEALNSSDTELRRRAGLMLTVLRPKVAEKAFREFLPEAKEERIRGLIERLAAAKDTPTKAQWQEVLVLARALAARVGRIQGKDVYAPEIDPAGLPFSRGSPEKVWSGRKVLVGRLDQDLSTLDRCVLVSNGPAGYVGRIYNSIVLVNGDLRGSTTIANSIVFCNGNLGEAVGIYRSIILTTGRFEGCNTAEATLFQAREVGRLSASRDNMYVTKGDVKATWQENDRFFPARAAAAPAAQPQPPLKN